MRIIAGALKGRTLHEPKGHRTHPMSEKIRGALFNALGDIEGLSVLDAFAGTGAIAIEAVSRGAKKSVATEKEHSAHLTIEKNVEDLRLKKQVEVVHGSVGGWSIHNMERKFDIVILDPPYDRLKTQILQTLINRHAKKGGIVVLSFPGHLPAPEFERVELVTSKNYGDAQLVFYRKIK